MRFVSVLFLTALLGPAVGADEIRISASDLLADYIREPLASYAEENNATIVVDSIGTLPAMDRMRANEADLAIIAVPEDKPVPRDEYVVYPFAYDVAVVVVNESNPIDEISLARLGGIFGANEEFNYNSWGDLGLSGWGSRSIKPLAGQKDGSVSLELFKHAVLKRGGMKTSVTVVKDEEVEDLVVSDALSIALLPGLPQNKKLKSLMVSSAKDGPAFGPSEDNVHYGDYPIRLAFFIVFNERDAARLKPVLRVLFEDKVAGSLRDNSLFALPDTVRRKLLIDLELE
ncbi:PstS family phosphate ABC transporter substrate-binding protein [Coraliomargarita parva]|uniref:PstS family phosphate ABC transporter substrate-binding protein n=1 Tax=Coraliomargarita parva TaxID=3014050 RepID=UPI0022B54448|nr:substrate-binding domain-containing protein [Coraliomargarita parva]